MYKRMTRFIAVGIAGLAAPLAALADMTYTFTRISSNSGMPVDGQLFVTVSDLGSGQVNFRFGNNVGLPASITQIYFDAEVLLGVSSVTAIQGAGNSTLVEFKYPAHPENFPNKPSNWQTTTGLSAEANSPVSRRGINESNEYLDVAFELEQGRSFDDVIAALNQGYVDSENRGIRIGMHVQAHGDGESDSYVNDPNSPTVVPAPDSAAIGVLGLVALAFGARRFR